MTSPVRISTTLLRAIEAEAAASPTREVCGLLFGTANTVAAYQSARNVAADSRSVFEIDPAELLAAHRAQRSGGPAIIGCYHSHPSGSPDPSPRDAAAAEPNGWLWLIVGADELLLWRAVPTGERHGRFDPVAFACIEGPPSPEDPVRR
ncbi:Mov34/MPN/PAD-1 family protein [uncultured Sphingomonas sp.]|uniref:Mov34/MPN/PAD-1 family protein n=1 Tax=uncultured Sphingomonas sp. TaxID=158754 RepID=UPI0035CBE042